jgi:hypothetical protein
VEAHRARLIWRRHIATRAHQMAASPPSVNHRKHRLASQHHHRPAITNHGLGLAYGGMVLDGRHADTVTSLPDSTQQPQQTQHISSMARWVPFLVTTCGVALGG